MQEDIELDSILKEAREGYQKRIDELKNSLKSISAGEKAPKKETQSEYDLNLSDSLKYSTTFRPSGTVVKKKFDSFDSSVKDFNINLIGFENTDNDLDEEVKSLKIDLEEKQRIISRMKIECENAEKDNVDLRNRIKDLTTCLNKVTEENYRLKEGRIGNNGKELDEMKIHYKEKIAKMREGLIIRDTEIAKYKKELESQTRLQTSIRQVCELQVKEISEEYARNLKQAGTFHSEELLRLKLNFENMSESQINEFLSEIKKLQSHISEYERSNRLYQEKIEKIIISKEKLEKILNQKDSELKECQIFIKDLESKLNENDNKNIQFQKNIQELQYQLKESQQLSQKFRIEIEKLSKLGETQEKIFKDKEKILESKLRQLSEENLKKQQNINKLVQVLEDQELNVSRTRNQYEDQLNEEKSRVYSLQEKYQEYDQDFEELSRTLDTYKHRAHLLEDQLNTQSHEYKKKSELETSRFKETIKRLENELKNLYLANSAQAKEMEALKLLCLDIEKKQEDELKELNQLNEEKLREIKKTDKVEYLKLCDALEANKISLHHAECNIDKMQEVIKDFQQKEKVYLQTIKNTQKIKEQFDENLNKYKVLHNNHSILLNKYSKLRQVILLRFKQVKESYKNCVNSTVDLFLEHKKGIETCLETCVKGINDRLERLKKINLSSQGKYLGEIDNLRKLLEKNVGQVGLLEQEVQKNYLRCRIVEDENLNLKKRIELCDCGKRKQETYGACRGIIEYIDSLEKTYSESYSELESCVVYLKQFISEDSYNSNRKYQDCVEQAKKTIDFYRDKLVKLENEKSLELNKSQNELLSLQQRLSQVLEDIVKY